MTEAAVVATEVQQPQVQSAEQVEADEAFSAGFGDAPAQAATETGPVEGASTEAKPVTDKTVAAPEPVLINGVPEAEWNAAVAKAAGPLVEQARAEIRKNFGQIGEVNKALKDIQAKLAAGGTPAARKKLTSEALKRVNEELPGLGDALAQDLSEFLDSPAVAAEAAAAKETAEAKGQTFDPEAFFTQKIGPALAQIEDRANQKAELRIVKSVHRDFETVVQSPEFAGWLGTLPAERQKTIRESDDGFIAADAVTEFKAHRDKSVKAKADKTNRLESALTPSGDRRPSSHVSNDEDADFDKGYKSVK